MHARRAHQPCLTLALLLALACLLAPAGARAETLDGGDLDVTTNSVGGLQATYGGTQLFYSISWSGFFLQLTDGTLSERAFGPGWMSATQFTPVSQSPVTRAGDTQSQDMVFAARRGDSEVARVVQTTRVRDGARTFRVTYSVENRSASTLRYRAIAGGDLYVGGSDGGTGFSTSDPRFVGNEAEYSGVRGGVEEVLSSQLPGDASPVAVAPWHARQQGHRGSVQDAISSTAGLVDGVLTTASYDTALAVEWDDHLADGAGLAPGATARYEVLWHPHIPPRVTLQTTTTQRYLGARHVVNALLSDASGDPVAGAALRFTVSGANEHGPSAAVTTGADGRAEIAYSGDHAGYDFVTVFLDVDGDGQLGDGEPRRSTSVWWQSPLSLEQMSWGNGSIGEPQTFVARMREPTGAAMSGADIAWSVTGANPTTATQVVRTDGNGSADIRLRARNAGDDTLTVFRDTDGDGQPGAGELAVTRLVHWEPAPPQLVLTSWNWQQYAGSAATVQATLRDEFGVVIDNGAVRWWAEGANPKAPASARTASDGRASLSIPSQHSGTGTVRAYFDRDDDGVQDDGEPTASVQLTWSPAPPPPTTWKTLDGAGLDVTVSSVGRLQARFDALPGMTTRDLFDNYEGGFYVRVFDGPLAGRTFGPEFYNLYGDPQPEPTRTGDTVQQRSSWTIRSGDVDLLRVHQTARLRDGQESIRMTWSVENLGAVPIRLRTATTGDPIVGGSDVATPVADDGPTRFVGIEHSSGFAAGLESVGASRLPGESTDVPVPAWSGVGIGYAWRLREAIAGAGLGGTVAAGSIGDAVGVQWDDRAGEGQALGTGAAASARYEAVWRLRRPAALRLSPPSDVAETRHVHRVTATLLGDDEQPRNGVTLRWKITGAHPQEGAGVTSGLGQGMIAWTGRRTGRDELTVYADEDDDGVRDAGESQRTVTVDWRVETAVDAPVIAPIVRPDGTIVQVALQTDGNRRFFQIPIPAISLFPKCADGSPQLNLNVGVNIDAGAGVVVAGSVSLVTVDPTTNDLAHPLGSILPVGPAVGGTFGFVIECINQATLYICYDLEEIGLPIEHFCVLLGGVGLYDPSGTIYDADAAAALVAQGVPESQARSQTAIAGARVVLQREFGGAFRQVLSGDPFVTPNINPIVTEADGRFAWNVSPGTYRVVASAQGYDTATSRSAIVPPPDLDVNLGLHRNGDPLPPPSANVNAGAAIWVPGTDIPPPPVVTPPPPPPPPSPAVTQTPAATPPAASAKPATTSTVTPSMTIAGAPRLASGAKPSAPASPLVAIMPRLAGRLSLGREGVLGTPLRCVTTIACSGVVSAVAPDGKMIGHVSYALAGRESRTVKLRLSRKARAALRRGKVKQLSVAAAQAYGPPLVLGTVRVPKLK